jgi:hypothetical protein
MSHTSLKARVGVGVVVVTGGVVVVTGGVVVTGVVVTGVVVAGGMVVTDAWQDTLKIAAIATNASPLTPDPALIFLPISLKRFVATVRLTAPLR